ncbi:elongation factor G [Nocardia amikacinitolerans]|uniref:GTP-binding protein n=1 Tax=Nocardia amikacinitolerans TaxID=756689 RepID=UPI0020A43546|nr:GTP-binding protein [Nocardia amikacinitolerans]MCP2296811.1 elongation factor G [Nocardia amikacinitolerans]
MGAKAIDPQTIRNVTIIGDPDETTRVARLIRRRSGRPGSGTRATVDWKTGRVEHTIRIAALTSHAPIAELERSIRVADGVVAVVNAAANPIPHVETMLRVADDHQVARLCLINGLDHPAADFDRCVRTIADTRGAVPLALQIPLGAHPTFEGVIDLLPLWALESLAAELYGSHWEVAERWYGNLVKTVMEQAPSDPNASPARCDIPLDQLHHRIRYLTRIGDVVPVLCGAAPTSDDIATLLDAIARYLPSPMDVCQPEHALDY